MNIQKKVDGMLEGIVTQLKKKKRKIDHEPSTVTFRRTRKRKRYTREEKEKLAKKEEKEKLAKREDEQKTFKKNQQLAKYPYWVWKEINGWERETWRFYFTDVSDEMETVLQSLIRKAHRFNEGHEKTAITHQPQVPSGPYGAMLALCGPPVIVCTGCTKFKFGKCKLSESKVKRLI